MEAIALSEHTRVELRGIDLRDPLDESDVAALRRALAERHLLVFRDQQLDAARQEQVGACFGALVDEGGTGAHHVFVSNARADGVLAEGRPLLFHSDNLFTDRPLTTVALYGLVIGDGGAPTRFANARRACEQLTPEQRSALGDATVLNLSGFAGGWYRYRDATTAPHHPRAVHPVLLRNPRTGHRSLSVSEQQSDRILGLTPEESEAMLAGLFALLYADDNVVTHHWRTGDLVVWDNLALQHGRPAIEGRAERTLRRVAMVDGDTAGQHAWTAVSLAAEGKGR
jgi:taurine dioxygenase